ncbi:hypothetical protein BDR05DRAFT_953510 [Suillus weaverae]|nr:hypothetical protein BDR05DRAFT_953510 [Suillus weaverae]
MMVQLEGTQILYTQASPHFQHVCVKMEVPRKAGNNLKLQLSSLKVQMVIYHLLTDSSEPAGPLSTPPQHSCYTSNSSPPLNSPLSSRATSTLSETDPEDSFPLIPDSKCSGSAYYHLTGPPSETKSPASENQSEAPDNNTVNAFLRHMDGLSPASCRYVVHYKEAVHERQHMRLLMTYWELKETNRLCTLLMSLYAKTNVEFRRAEQDAQALLTVLVTKQSLTHVADDAQYLDAVRQRNKTSLQETDAQLNLLKDRSMQRLPVKSSAEDSDSLSNCIGDSPSVTDE